MATLLRDAGHDIKYVGDFIPGAKDTKVIEIAGREDRVLITDDKDFGEIMYRLQRPLSGLILLRLPNINAQSRMEILRTVLSNYKVKRMFTIIAQGSIRQKQNGT